MSGRARISAQKQHVEEGHGTPACARLTTCLAAPALAQAPKVGDPPEALNMRLVGMNDLQARSAYQPTIHQQGDRWIAYIGHHGGTHDVPKPVNPHDRPGRVQRHLDRRRHRSGASRNICATSRARKASTKPAARRWCASATAGRCRRAIRTRSTCCARSAARRTRSGTSPIPAKPVLRHAARRKLRGHAQELVGVRHRHRLPGLRRRRTGARAA